MADKQDISGEQPVEIPDFSGGIQDKSSNFLRKPGELERGANVRFDTIGAVKPGYGYIQQYNALTSTSSTSTSSSTTTTSTSTSSSTSSSTSTTITTTSTTTTG